MFTLHAARRAAALAVAAIAAEAVLSTGSPVGPGRHGVTTGGLAPPNISSIIHVLTILVALALLVCTPRLWRGMRTAVLLAIAGLLLLGLLDAFGGLDPAEAALDAGLALGLVLGRPVLSFRPAPGGDGHLEHELTAARAIVERHGVDSLSPFILRPDKAFHLAADGVLGYRVIGETAVVSGDPVAPAGSEPAVVASLISSARTRGWRVVIYGASARHLPQYRELGLRAMCVGEEAVVYPERFTLEGRPVRKLRQSAHRIARRGWEISAIDGREIGAELEAEIDAVEAQWRTAKRRLIGFAMGMGASEPGVCPQDLYLLARSPEGALGAVMHFISHCEKLSLDTMRRVGETPNGLNEALVCLALELARERGVPEVSLNYAGLAHLVRGQPLGNLAGRAAARTAIGLLGRRFQMERLVRFNSKFSPEWRPRYLVYESRIGLPRSVFRVLQAEGYLPQRARRSAGRAQAWRRVFPRLQPPAEGRLGR